MRSVSLYATAAKLVLLLTIVLSSPGHEAQAKLLTSNPITSCPPLPPHTPQDVNDLAPNDIKVVMALGDSITAGFGILGLDGGLDEYRGLSGPIGGDDDAVTIANFVKYYNPSVVGASVGQHLFELPGWPHYPDKDVLNGAQSSATAGDFPNQVNYLIDQLLKLDVNFTADWKMLNILIGANDACIVASRNGPLPPVNQVADEFEANYQAAITTLYEKVPKLLINSMLMFNVSQVYDLTHNFTYCDDLHRVVRFECEAAFEKKDNAVRVYLDDLLQEFNQRILKIASEWNAKNYPEFAFAVQTFTQHLVIPDFSYLSTLDCFHPSLLAHQQIAVALWNCALLPPAQKPTFFTPNQPITCPTPDDRIWTY